MTSFEIKDYISEHFKNNSMRYVLILFAAILGIVVGVILALTGFSYVSLLNISDKTFIGYINGTTGYGGLFLSRFVNLFFCIVLIFLFNLIKHTSILNYLFVGYQVCLLTLLSSAIVSIYGISGFINVLICVFPINLINIFLLCIFACICMERACIAHSEKLTFGEGFKDKIFWVELLIAITILFVFCLIYSFVLPVFIKSFVVVSY